MGSVIELVLTVEHKVLSNICFKCKAVEGKGFDPMAEAEEAQRERERLSVWERLSVLLCVGL